MYEGMDLNEASLAARGTSVLPTEGTEIEYADGIDDESAMHDLERRLRQAGLYLDDHGGGYTVRRVEE